MLQFDLVSMDFILNLILFFAPIIFVSYFTFKNKAFNLSWLVIWALVTSLLFYLAFERVSNLILFAAFFTLASISVIWGLNVSLQQMLRERARVLSNASTGFIKRAVREASLSLEGDWICEKRDSYSLKFNNIWLTLGLLKLKRVRGIYVEAKPDVYSILDALISASLFNALVFAIIYYPKTYYVSFNGVTFYLPIFALILSIYIVYSMSNLRKDTLKLISLGIITTREKVNAAEKLEEALRIIALAERVKRKKQLEKIREATELAKAYMIASKIAEKKDEEKQEEESEKK